MSDKRLWNPAKKLDKAGITQDKAEKPEMSGLRAEHVRVKYLKPG
jgi:hypothetical protein